MYLERTLVCGACDMSHHSNDMLHALQEIDSIPRQDNEPVFNAPWEAEVFALCLSLYEQGQFTWKEWAEALSSTIVQAQKAGDPDLGDTYYLHWLKTLERIVVEKKLGNAQQLGQLYNSWATAASTTKHGDPIELPGRRDLHDD